MVELMKSYSEFSENTFYPNQTRLKSAPHQRVLRKHCRRPNTVTATKEKPGQATTRVAVVSMATAKVKLGASQLLVKCTTKLCLRDETKANAVSYKQELALLSTEVQERDF